MFKEVILMKKNFVLILIFFTIFSTNMVYGAESINDYIMEEIGDNTEHPFYTFPIRFGHYLNIGNFSRYFICLQYEILSS